MKNPKFGKRLMLVGLLVLSITLLFAGFSSAKAQETGAVCPHSNVKWETDGGYEYSDGTATVSGNADQVTVSAAEGYIVTGVCVKIGGPGGGSLTGGAEEGTYGPYEYGISHVVVTTVEKPVEPSYKLSVGSCLMEATGEFHITAYNKGNVPAEWRLKGYGSGPIIDLGEIPVGGSVTVVTSAEATWTKQVKIDGNWVNNGGTHVTNVDGHTKNGLFCDPPPPPPEYKLSVGSCLEADTNQFQINAYNKSNVSAEWRLKGSNGTNIDLGEMAVGAHVMVTTSVETTWTKQVKIDGNWVNKGGTHVTNVAGHTKNGFFCEPPPPPPPPPPNWSLEIGITDAFCEGEIPVMEVTVKNTGDAATYLIQHESGDMLINQNLGSGESVTVVTTLIGTFTIYVDVGDEGLILLTSLVLDPDLNCKPEPPEEEGWGRITRTPITCPQCVGSGPLEVLELGDKPVAWDYRAESCYSILVERGIGTDDYTSFTKEACGSKGSIVVVAPADMIIFGDVEGYSTSQPLEADRVIVVDGRQYNVYFTNHNAYADVNGDGRANWHEKLKHNWWRGIWQYEQFCCAGMPLIETEEGTAIIKLPRICFNGVQLSLIEAGYDLNDEQTTQLAVEYIAADYGDIILVP